MVVCPMCGQDVSSTRAEMSFGGAMFPVYTCEHCSSATEKFSFALMPDGACVRVEDYAEYCRKPGPSSSPAPKKD